MLSRPRVRVSPSATLSALERQTTVNYKTQAKCARKAASVFPVKDAVKANDLEGNKTIDQLPQGPVINSSFMRMDTRFRRPCRA